MRMMKEVDIDDDEPLFRVRLIEDKSCARNYKYWEEYNPLKKTWFRLCDECIRKVCRTSDSLCSIHCNKENKTIVKPKTMKKKLKRLNTKVKKKNTEQESSQVEPMNDNQTEQIVKNDYEEVLNDSSEIVLSISSSLNKKQIAYVKEFITKFHNDSQTVEFTCESQLDYIDDRTTHVITNDFGSFTTFSSKQIIQACVRHIFVSSIDWIISSIEHDSILDHFPYEILRDKKSAITSRGIKQCRFDQLPVFPSSCIISVECHRGIKPLKMTREELIEIVELSGATLLNDYMQYQTLIILCNSKKEMLDRKNRNNDDDRLVIKETNIHYCKPDFLFDSIVRHEVQSIEKYCC